MRNNLPFLITTLILLLGGAFTYGQNTYNAGYASGTGGVANVHVGNYAGRVSTGYNNVFVGYYAAYYNTTGYFDVFVGTNAGLSNSTGTYNTFLGTRAGYYNSTAHYNTFVGAYAGYTNSTGYSNNFLGHYAGYSNTSGYQNSFVGAQAGYNNTIGAGNSLLGFQAGYYNSSGNSNSFMGSYAGYFNTTGARNTFLGSEAGKGKSGLSTGSNNSMVGYQAGFTLSNGGDNSLLGYRAGYALTAGNRNVFIGGQSGEKSTGGNENTFVGRAAGNLNTTGGTNTALGAAAGPSSGALANATALGHRAQVSASNSLVLGSINGVNGSTNDTKVGIRTTAPAYNLHVNGTAAKPGGGSWTTASDQRLKQEVSAFTDGLAVVEKIKPVWFRYNGKAGLPTQQKYVGIIAQQMQKIAPYTIGEFTYQDSTGRQEKYLDYDANALTYLLVNSVKELKQENEQKDSQIAALQLANQGLEARLAKLEQLLSKEVPTAEEDARLWQNEPNPTDGSTVIRYRIPALAGTAQIQVFTSDGRPVESFEITQRGEGNLTINASRWAMGTYLYRLLVDGQAVEARKLLNLK